ncbi:MAG: acyl-CoA dehydrogenase [Alphaproteobacteria bacterium]|nr:MAG: acyl-CoA dehydrogenase [Alphaproteobacteria bacterium]
MPTYRAPIKDMLYLLNDVLKLERYSNLKGFSEASPDIISAILKEGAKFNEEVLQPLNQSGDREGCTRHSDGSVTAPKGFKEAYKLYSDGGWGGLTAPPEYGGQGLPHVLGLAFEEMVTSANLSFSLYPFLTSGVVALLDKLGSNEQKETYLTNLIAGKWSGTMNLTEPQCGTDLGLLRTKAEAEKDGSYKITGTKIFISAGEHDLSENIIHLVLAKIPGGPDGVKGISLFIVPKLIDGKANGVACGSIEEKMGLHGNSTCLLNYDGAKSFLVGKEHEGLKAMFIMMNAARLGVGVQGLGVSEVANQNAADYARDRLQGRALSGAKYPDKDADPIIVHPDVRRMLLDGKCFNEGGRALAYWGGLLMDLAESAESDQERDHAKDMLALLIPTIKSLLTDLGYEIATNAQQVLGGHGYIAEWGMEQFVRDARITQIYEGTNGIQALDLVGRKLPREGGQAIRAYFEMIEGYCKDYGKDYGEFTSPLKNALGDLQQASLWLMQNAMKNPDNAGAGATSYLRLLGYVALGHMWAWMAITSQKALADGVGDKTFHQNKVATARYFMGRHLPQTRGYYKMIEAGSDELMAFPDDAF